MSTLLEIEAATEALPPEQKEELLLFLAKRLRAVAADKPHSRRQMTHVEVLAAIESSPIRFMSNWDALKEEVR
jgi:hypothetical protein